MFVSDNEQQHIVFEFMLGWIITLFNVSHKSHMYMYNTIHCNIDMEHCTVLFDAGKPLVVMTKIWYIIDQSIK
jgi:hypothetical protein